MTSIATAVTGARKYPSTQAPFQKFRWIDFPFEPRGAYPRDLVQIISDSSRFDGTQPVLNPEMIERAIQVYFIEE